MSAPLPLTVVLYAADGSIVGVEELANIGIELAKARAFELLAAHAGASGVELWQGAKCLAARGTDLLHIPRSGPH